MTNTFFTQLYSIIPPLEPPSWTREVNISQPWLNHALRGVVCLQYFWVYLQLRLTSLRVHTWNQWMEQNEPVHAIVANPLKPGVKWEQPSDIITTLAMWRPHWIQLVALDKMLTWQSNLHRSTFRQSRNALLVLKWKICSDLEKDLPSGLHHYIVLLLASITINSISEVPSTTNELGSQAEVSNKLTDLILKFLKCTASDVKVSGR